MTTIISDHYQVLCYVLGLQCRVENYPVHNPGLDSGIKQSGFQLVEGDLSEKFISCHLMIFTLITFIMATS